MTSTPCHAASSSHKVNSSEKTQPANQIALPSTSLKTIIVGDYYPYTFVNDKGVSDGFSVDVAKAVTHVMDLKLEIRVDTWQHATEALSNGTIDLLPMMAYSPERDKIYDFSAPHTIAYDALFSRNGAQKIRSLKDLGGKTVIVMNKDAAHQYLLSSGLAAEIKLILVDSLPDALRTLAQGKGDYALMPKLVGLIIIKNLNLTNLDPSSVVVDAYNRPFSFAVRNGNQALQERLSQGLSIIKSTGQYQEIYNKWFGALESLGLPWGTVIKYIAVIVVVFIFAALGMILWNVSLRKQVSLRTNKLAAEIQERKQAEEELRKSEDYFRTLTDMTPLGMSIIDVQGRYEYVNPAFVKIFGYDLPDIPTGKEWFRMAYPDTEYRKKAMVDWNDDLRSDLKLQIKPRVYEVRCREGDFRIILFRTVTLPTGKHFIIYEDITERKRAEEEKAKLEGQLQQSQKMDMVGRLAGGVAHDFNNMLGVIIGHAEIALDQVDAAQPLHADLEEIRNAANRSADLTRQLLAFARQQTIAPKVLDLNETITNTLKMLQRLIGEDINLKWQSEANLWPIRVDPSQIDQLLANLCINARDAIAGVGKLTIETGNTSFDEDYCTNHAGFVPGEYVLLAVSDDGSGMDKETTDKIFEPFFTTKGIGKGTGLGLSTVYGIVKQNNGFINVYSEPGQGTTFTIYLPRHLGTNEQVLATTPQESFKRGKETILLVEDEPALLDLNRKILTKQGYQVLTAGSPNEAIRLAGEHTGVIHLLMTDVVMPEMNGRDLADKMLSLNPNLKCLFTSGYTANVIAHHGVLDENVHFIQKPFSRRDLAAKMREVLDQK